VYQRLADLSEREREVLYWCAKGKTAWEMAAILGLSRRTVEHYKAQACKKLVAVNDTHAVVKAMYQGLIAPLLLVKLTSLLKMLPLYFLV
jgi:DNA-binding CsgD family transcriptional regulator